MIEKTTYATGSNFLHILDDCESVPGTPQVHAQEPTRQDLVAQGKLLLILDDLEIPRTGFRAFRHAASML